MIENYIYDNRFSLRLNKDKDYVLHYHVTQPVTSTWCVAGSKINTYTSEFRDDYTISLFIHLDIRMEAWVRYLHQYNGYEKAQCSCFQTIDDGIRFIEDFIIPRLVMKKLIAG